MNDRGSFTAVADDFLDGMPIKRLMFCYRTIGCAHYRSDSGGCTVCAFPAMSASKQPTDRQLKAQLDNCLAEVDWEKAGLAELDLFCAGSFFNDEELPPGVRMHAYNTAARLSGLKKLLVESRPEYVTDERILEAKEILPANIHYEIAIGLESVVGHTREVLINKGFGLEDFERALKVIARHQTACLVYIFLKPPGLSEKQALEDSVKTVEYVFEKSLEFGLRKMTAAVQPAFVQQEGNLFELYEKGRYRPPWLWTVVELVKRTHGLGELQIGTADDSPAPVAVRSNCGRCDAAFEEALALFNRTQDASVFDKLECECKSEWKALIGD